MSMRGCLKDITYAHILVCVWGGGRSFNLKGQPFVISIERFAAFVTRFISGSFQKCCSVSFSQRKSILKYASLQYAGNSCANILKGQCHVMFNLSFVNQTVAIEQMKGSLHGVKFSRKF